MKAMPRLSFPALCSLGVLVFGYGGAAEAALMSSTLDTFSNNSTGGAAPAGYAPVNANVSVTLESLAGGQVGDFAEFDAADDGYLNVTKTVTDSSQVGFVRSLGVIEAADVGSTVEIDIAFFKVADGGFNSNHQIRLDNASVGGAGEGVINTFGARPANGKLSDAAVNGAPLRYTIQPGDVGFELTYVGAYFDSTGDDQVGVGRDLGVDAVSITVSQVPEPATLVGLAALLSLGWACRR